MAADYPPPHHLLRDLRVEIVRRAGGVAVRAPAAPGVCGPGGGVGAGALGVVLDVLGGNLAIEAVRPDWALTSSLELHRLRPTRGDAIEATGRPLRAGRTQVVVDAEVAGPDGPAAVGSITFTRIARRDETPEYAAPESERTAFAREGSGLDGPLREALGIRTLDPAAGALEMDVVPYVRNSVGALQGGALVALVVEAASAAAAPVLRGAAQAECLDLRVHFLALGREGPIRSRTALLARGPGDARLRVDLVDAGQDGRLVASAFARVGRLAGA